MHCKIRDLFSYRFWEKHRGDDFVVWFGFHEIIIRDTLKWHINAFSTGRRVKCGPRWNKGIFSLSTLEWVYFVLSQWGEFEWSMRKETALVPCTQSQSQNHMLRTRGCIFWLSEKPEVKILQLCTILCALLNSAPLPRNKNALLGKKNKINQFFKIHCAAPTWYILQIVGLKHHFHCCSLTLTLGIMQKGESSRQDFSLISDFESS